MQVFIIQEEQSFHLCRNYFSSEAINYTRLNVNALEFFWVQNFLLGASRMYNKDCDLMATSL